MSYADVRHWYEDPNDPDMPCGRCYGTERHGCGRFVTAGAFHCQRCLDEFEAQAQHELDEDRRIDECLAAEAAYWTAYWQSPEGQAEEERERRQAAEYAAAAVALGLVEIEPSDDLPY